MKAVEIFLRAALDDELSGLDPRPMISAAYAVCDLDDEGDNAGPSDRADLEELAKDIVLP